MLKNFVLDPRTRELASQLYRMTLPMIIGVFAMMSYQLVDSAFIGQLGVKPLAVIGFTIPVYQLVVGIQVGIGIATTAVISRALGSREFEFSRQLGTLVIAIGFMAILLLCLLIWYNQNTILSMMGAHDNLRELVREYWLPWLISTWLGAMLYFGYSIYRSHGHTKLPGMLMMLTSILNIIFDPLFIFVFEMGIAGAAWATISAFSIGLIVIYPKIFSQRWLTLSLDWRTSYLGLKSLVSIMLPAMMSQFIPPISAVAATAVVAGLGEQVVAAWGLGTRIEFFSIIVVLALTMAMPPMIGRMRGKLEYESIEHLVKIAVGFVVGWQLLIAAVLMLMSPFIGPVLTSDGAVVSILQQYLWMVPISFSGLGVCIVLVSVSNAIGVPLKALLISALRLFCCYLPCLWFGAYWGGLTGLMLGAAIGNIAAGIMSWYLYRQSFYQLKQQLDNSATV